MLYPKEDGSQGDQQLTFYCKTCPYSKRVTNPADFCVYRSYLTDEQAETTHNLAALAKDPTLPVTHDTECPQCHSRTIVYLQSSAGQDRNFRLTNICRNCFHTWKLNLAQT